MKARLIFASGWILAAGSGAAADKVLQAFEGDGYGDWKTEGTAFGLAPISGKMDGLNAELTAYSGDSLACSAHGGDAATGTLTSPKFKVTEDHLAFLIAGGNHPGKTAVQLLQDGKVVREATGQNSLQCRQVVWDIAEFRNQEVQIRIIDDETGEWGVIAADQFVMTGNANYKFPPTTKGGKPYGAGLIAAEGIPGLTIPDGTTATIVADHSNLGVTSPTSLCFGEKGEIYVAETHRFRFGVPDNRDHLYWYLDDISSRSIDDRRKMYDKWKDKEEHTSVKFLTDKSEIIRVLDKPGADGKSAGAHVFADGFNDILDGTGAGVFSYEGTTYFSCIPNIWALRDTKGEGKADDKKKLFEGFGVRVSFSGHDLNGFALGPDGRLYGTLGDRGMNITTAEGKHIEQPDRGCIFRFDPDGSNFEIVHNGLRNPKEIAFDDMGNGFSVDNNADQGDQARIVYMVEGGESGWNMGHQGLASFSRQIGLEERPPNPWMEEKMWAPAFKGQPAFLVPPIANLTSGPSGLTYHPGAGFLKEEVGHFLICDYRGGAANSGLWSFKVEPSGAGMKMTDSHQFNWGAAVTDVEYSWDGKVYVADFIGGWSSHEEGRIYSLEAKDRYLAKESDEAAKLIAEGIEKKPTQLLVKLLGHPDMRVRLRAEFALTRRPEGMRELGLAATTKGDLHTRLHGIWGLGIIARRGGAVLPDAGEGFVAVPGKTQREDAKKILLPLLKDPDPEIRAQTVKVIGDSGLQGDAIQFAPLISDESPRVRFFATIAAGRMKAIGSFSEILTMLENNEDPYLRHAGSYALSLMCNAQQIASLNDQESRSVRMAAVIALRRLKSESVAAFLGDSDPEIVDEAIRAIHDESIEPARPFVAAMLNAKTEGRPPMMWQRLLHSAFRIGDEENLKRVLDFVIAGQAPEAPRKEALRLLGEWQKPFPVDQSLGHMAPLPERDLKMIVPVLNSRISDLIKLKGKLLEPALELVTKYNLDLSTVSNEDLKSLIQNSSLPGLARGKALDLYASRNPSDLGSLLQSLASGKDDDLAISAAGRLAKSDAAAALSAVEKAVTSGSARRQQQAWGIVATLPGAAPLFVQELKKVQEKLGVSPETLELLDAAAERSEPEVKAALESYQQAITASTDPLAAYLGSLEGGNPSKGGELFESHPAAQCMRCHSGGHGGGEAGPDLSGVGKRSERRYLLESLVSPNAKVVAGYGIGSITLKGGKNVAGIILEQTDDHVDVDSNGKVLRVMRSDIESMIDPVSPMPPMGTILNGSDMRDIVAWLATRDQKGPEPKKRPAPEVVKP